jgi:hypothetical protein
MFSDALNSHNSSSPDASADATLRTITSKERGVAALKWMLHKLVTKHPALWGHLMREKRTIQEAKEAAVARIRKYWEDRGLGLFTRCDMTHKARQMNVNLTSHTWNDDIKYFERSLLHGGTPMCLHASLVSSSRNTIRLHKSSASRPMIAILAPPSTS